MLIVTATFAVATFFMLDSAEGALLCLRLAARSLFIVLQRIPINVTIRRSNSYLVWIASLPLAKTNTCYFGR